MSKLTKKSVKVCLHFSKNMHKCQKRRKYRAQNTKNSWSWKLFTFSLRSSYFNSTKLWRKMQFWVWHFYPNLVETFCWHSISSLGKIGFVQDSGSGFTRLFLTNLKTFSLPYYFRRKMSTFSSALDFHWSFLHFPSQNTLQISKWGCWLLLFKFSQFWVFADRTVINARGKFKIEEIERWSQNWKVAKFRYTPFR